MYKNPSWVWGQDRRIRLEDHRLAPRSLPSDDKRDHEGRVFVCHPQTNSGFFCLAHHVIDHFILEHMKTTCRKSWIRWDATWSRNFNITMTSRIDVRPACGRRAAVHFLSFLRAGTDIWDRIISHVQKRRKLPIWCARIWYFNTYHIVVKRLRRRRLKPYFVTLALQCKQISVSKYWDELPLLLASPYPYFPTKTTQLSSTFLHWPVIKLMLNRSFTSKSVEV